MRFLSIVLSAIDITKVELHLNAHFRSRLLVVATKKSFAGYFAKLLRTKTSGQLKTGGAGVGGSSRASSCGVHKSYRCLVCISPALNDAIVTSSMASEVDRLQRRTNTIMKHFLEPSIRAPKRFVGRIPDGVEDADSWLECLLRITKVTNVCTVVGNQPSMQLARELWGDYGMLPIIF